MDLQATYQQLLDPTTALVSDMAQVKGDIMILGGGGKMGPALARLAKKSSDLAGVNRTILSVSRFSEPGLKETLEREGIKTIEADLLDDGQLQGLPEVPNVLYLAGMKFGTTGKESLTWAMNAYLPGRVAEKFRGSRIVVFSTGNVYPMTPVLSGGPTESHAPDPVGEYAQSCLGRERMFQHFSSQYKTPVLIFRLNYANDVSYGVLLEIAKAVRDQRAIDLRMGHVNVIWQANANEWALRSLLHCETPAKLLNIAGPETISIRWIAGEFGKIFEVEPVFVHEEQPTALLNNAAEAFRLFGYPSVSLLKMVDTIASWLQHGGKTINKPTHFQERTGKF